MATRRVVLNNKQRDKSSGQKTREALVLEETARSMDAAGAGRPEDNSCKSAQNNFRWDEEVASQMDVSARTIQSGVDVYRMAYPEEYVHDDLRNPEKYDVSEEIPVVVKEYETFEDGMYDLVTDNTTHREKGRYSEMAIVRP